MASRTTNPFTFLQQVRAEGGKVTWPTRRETLISTLMVIAMAFLAAIFWGTLTESPIVWFFVSDSYRHLLVGLFLLFPLSLVYAIARHRVLLVSVIRGAT